MQPKMALNRVENQKAATEFQNENSAAALIVTKKDPAHCRNPSLKFSLVEAGTQYRVDVVVKGCLDCFKVTRLSSSDNVCVWRVDDVVFKVSKGYLAGFEISTDT